MKRPDLSARTAIVTGGASGIGRVLVHALSESGASVMAVDLDADRLEELKESVHDEERRERLATLALDVSDPTAGDRTVEAAIARFGRLDTLVNNAGIGRTLIRKDCFRNPPMFWETPSSMWERFMAVNANSMFYMMKAAVPRFIAQNHGRIICVTTMLGSMLRRGTSAYGVSKAAAEALAGVAAADLADKGVTVNVVIPGGLTDTGMVPEGQPMSRESLLSPDVMIAPVLWLLTDDAAGVTGRRFRGNAWPAALDGSAAAEAAGAPIGW